MASTPQPSTPASRRSLHVAYRPLTPSPLASPSPSRTSFHHARPPPSSISEHRRFQFKSQSTTPTRTPPPSHSLPSRARSISSSAGAIFTSSSPHHSHPPHPLSASSQPEDPQKSLLRARIRAKCLERAQKARARAVKKRRYTGYSDRSSDGFDPDDDADTGPSRTGNLSALMDQEEEDEEEDDDDIMNDELFRRIMAQTNRRTDHSYRVSYALEVGSSFDPNLEDVAAWEHELFNDQPQDEDVPADLADDELEAYAEECARQAVLDDFADIPEEELFHLSDIDDIPDGGEGMDTS